MSGPRRLVCFGGGAPVAGETMQLFDRDGRLGQGRVRRSAASDSDRCRLNSAHDVYFELFDEPRSIDGTGPLTVGVLGLSGLTEGARLVSELGKIQLPPGRTRHEVWLALDQTGDGLADLVVTAFECDDNVITTAMPRAADSVSTWCIDYWSREVRWRRLNRAVFYNCS